MAVAPFINASNASELAQKRWQLCPTHSKPGPASNQQHASQNPANPIQEEMTRTWEQLIKLNELIDDCTDPKEQDALTRAKDRQFRIWARLSQLPTDPKPAIARPTRKPDPMPEPTVPQPVVVAPTPEQPK